MSSDCRAFTTTRDAAVMDGPKRLYVDPPLVLDDQFIETLAPDRMP